MTLSLSAGRADLGALDVPLLVVALPAGASLDEPLTALDAALRERLRGELNRLLRTLGITAIYVTHDQAEAMALGDRIVVMSKGAIAQVGAPRDIYFAPASRFVAEFVGAANILEGVSRSGHLALPGGRLPIGETSIEGPAVAMVRPESIVIVAAESAGLTGEVAGVSFVGDRQRLSISGAAARPVMVDVPNTLTVKAGDRVGLAIDPAAIRLLPQGETKNET
jgi:putative spermidine/putrescine transport system ATP-binding protein